MQRYHNKTVPSESSLRAKYVPLLYKTVMNDMIEKASNSYIWVSIDETTDVEQRLVANFIFGILDGRADSVERQKCYLLNVATVEAANASNMAGFFNDSLSLLWPNGKFLEFRLWFILNIIFRYSVQQSTVGGDRRSQLYAEGYKRLRSFVPQNGPPHMLRTRPP